MGESFRQIPEDNRDSIEYDRALENSQSSIEFIPASVKKRNKFNNELGPIIGITDTDDLAKLRRHLKDGETVPQLKDVVLDIEAVNFLRQYYGFEALSQEEYELLLIQSTGVESGVEHVSLEEEISTPEGRQREEKQTAVIDPERHNRDKGDGELDNILNKYFPEDEPDKRGGATTSEVPAEHDPRQDESVSISETSPSKLDLETQTLLDELPGAEVLEQELNGVVDSIVEQETGVKLARIKGEIYPGEGELETLDKSVEIEQLKQEARQAIQRYKEFGDRHAPNLRTESVQDTYRQLEKVAWDKVEELSHKLDGHLSRKLPQLRDILTANKDLTNILDAKDFLVNTKTIKLNPEGNITHIVDDEGNEVELNRPRTFEEIFDKSRPVRIIYTGNNENKKLGYIIEGLNSNTPDWIAGVLSDNQFLEPIIVDTWDTPIEHILPNTETESSLYPIDKTPKLTPAEELSNVQVKENIGDTSKQDEQLETNSKEQLDNLRTAYARAEEAWNRKRGDEDLEEVFELAREAYNTELERVLKLQVAEGQEANIHQIFQDEVIRLRDSRIVQSQELQGKWEKKFNGAKERFLGWATKNKTRWMLVNIGLFAAGAAFSLTGVGLPVSGALEATRRSLGAVMSGVSARNSLVGLMEDGEINRLGIKFKAVIPKLVDESLQQGYIERASDADLSTKLSTLEAYYRLNGGEFHNKSQQTAYESILNELGQRVEKNVISSEQNQNALASNSSQSRITEITDEMSMSQITSTSSKPKSQYVSTNETIEQSKKNIFNFGNEMNSEIGSSEIFTSELLTSISKTRVDEFAKFRRNRNLATIAGIATTGLLGGFLINDMAKPGGMFRPNVENSSIKPSNVENISDAQGTEAGSTGRGLPPGAIAPEAPVLPDTDSGEVVKKAAEQVVDKGVSSLDPGETLWGEMSKQLGPNASPDQIQHALENYMQSGVGQNTMFQLAQGTEGGRGLLAQWGIDNPNEMASLSKEQLYKVSRYLAPGQLEGISHFNIDHLEAFQPAEYVAPSPAEAPTIDPVYPKTPVSSPVGTESLGSESSVPPAAEALVATPSPEVSPIAGTEFTESLSQALDTNNLTDTQIESVLKAYPDKVSLYDLLLQNEVSNPDISELLAQYGVYNIDQFADLSGPELYELAQAVGVENLNQLPGFELNDIILSQFENAPDSLTLVDSVNGGTRPLSLMDNYIAKYAGDLPGSGSLGKLVLEKYVLETDEGKVWLYDAIQNHQAPKSPLAFELQKAKELFSQEGIKSPADLEKLLVDRNGNPSARLFWEKLSRVLKPGPMPGIKKALQLVLAKE
jgi:hypothetical protein